MKEKVNNQVLFDKVRRREERGAGSREEGDKKTSDLLLLVATSYSLRDECLYIYLVFLLGWGRRGGMSCVLCGSIV